MGSGSSSAEIKGFGVKMEDHAFGFQESINVEQVGVSVDDKQDEEFEKKEEQDMLKEEELVRSQEQEDVEETEGKKIDTSKDKQLGQKADEDSLLIPQTHEIVIPSYSRWFHLNKIHKIEKNSLPEFFTNRIPSKTPQVYVKYRNFMVNSYRLNPNEYFTVTSARRNMCGDAGAIFRVHKFLSKWGLINYQVNAKEIPKAVEPPFTGEYSTRHDAPRGLFPFQSYKPAMQIPDMSRLKKMMTRLEYPAESEEQAADSAVKVEGSKETVSNGKWSSHDEKRAFKKPKLEDMINKDWTKKDLMALLQSLQRNGSNWMQIARDVGNKTPEQCILRFLQLPIEDSFLEDEESFKVLKYGAHLPFSKADNPVMSTLAFLIGLVDPNSVRAMTARAISTIVESRVEEQNNAGIPAKKSVIKDDGGCTKTQEQHESKSDLFELEKLKEQNTSYIQDKTRGNEVETAKKNNIKFDNIKEKDSQKENDQSKPSHAFESDIKPNQATENVSDVMKEAVEVAIASIGARSFVFANNEERTLNAITNKLINTQIRKVEVKLKLLDTMEKSLEIERKAIQKQQEEVFIQRFAFSKHAIDVLDKLDHLFEDSQQNPEKFKENLEALRKTAMNPPVISVAPAFTSTPGPKTGTNHPMGSSANEPKYDSSDELNIKPISMDTPQLYRYWSG